MSGSLSGVQIEAGPITGYENYIKPTIFILLLIIIGNVLNAGFEVQ